MPFLDTLRGILDKLSPKVKVEEPSPALETSVPEVVPAVEEKPEVKPVVKLDKPAKKCPPNKKKKNVPVKKADPEVSPRNLGSLPWIATAKDALGIEEEPGDSDNETILKWAKDIGIDDEYTNDSIPWCALFVSYCLKDNGIEITDQPLWALSYNTLGTKLSEPAFGCIMVFKRQGGGHVGFYISEDDDTYHILGGNQGDKVCVKKIAKENCVGYRWPPGQNKLLVKGRIIKELDGEITSEDQMK